MQTQGVNPPAPQPESIHEQHAGLRIRFGELAAERDPDRSMTLLVQLSADLRSHFAFEELEDGFFDDILRQKPSLYDRVEMLRQEHVEFMDILNGLLDRLGRGAQNLTLRDETIALAGRLLAHEAAESQLIAETTYGEIGPAD